MLVKAAPLLFVLLWSTGFIFSKLGAPFAEPFTFLALRFSIVAAILVPVCVLMRVEWPKPRVALDVAIAGALVHAIYLGGVMWAFRLGMPAGITAVVVSMQPLLTSLLAGPVLGETVRRDHWIALLAGFIGAVMVLLPKLELPMHGPTTGINIATIAGALLGLAGITFGTIYQKARGRGGHLLANMACQFMGALVISAVLAAATETREIIWSRDLVIAQAWLIFVLSIGAAALLVWMIRRDAVSQVTAMFYLVPAVTTLMAVMFFGEQLLPVQIAGIAVTSCAVLWISRGR